MKTAPKEMTMINPLTVMRMINERHSFIMNHLDFFSFLKENFGDGIAQGSIVEITVKDAEGEPKTISMEIQETDMKFFDTVKDLINQVV